MRDNVSILNKNQCCGCTACYSTCPTDAINMMPDVEGYLYPSIDGTKCIQCGKCLDVCSSTNFYSEKQHVFYCKSMDDALRKRSSSGGLFTAIAEYCLKRKGLVCAVGYSDNCTECLHKIIDSVEDLDDLRRAKFIQSKKYDVFNRLMQALLFDRLVFFCGTPCEVGGLRQFLDKDFENLITADLICGCVSSPKVYERYTTYMEEKYGSVIKSVNFKDKRKGWNNEGKAIAITFANGEEYYNSIFEDDYCVSFHSRYNIRPSCFHCKYRSVYRVADITLGDFWGIEHYVDNVVDRIGTSMAIVNTAKGLNILNSLYNMEVGEVDLDIHEYSIKYNCRIDQDPPEMPSTQRTVFYEDIKNEPFNVVSEKYLKEIKERRKQQKLSKI